MNNAEMVDCGCCGRIHENIAADCRSFRTCPKCGDGYLTIGYGSSDIDNLAFHVATCDGTPSSNIVEEEPC